MTTDSRPSRVRPHAFEQDDEATVGDYFDRSWCRHCQLPGEPGDERHPIGARLPLHPEDARERDLRILGERDDDETGVT